MSGDVQWAADLISDGKQTPLSVKDELHIRAVSEGLAHFSEMPKPAEQIRRRCTGPLVLSTDVCNPGGEVRR